ncbi:hypothetical protein GH714_036294 [Hevea brasiliensis]|uniref:LsmAD domain-containing protein n=1 Tax=Hevea brasiliensis TaxID=3981 RepID=A0A6A6NEP2_HEVBR|nr:hypothetical protein GH714_036294 [Hevea brasiliensis]
MPASLPQYVTEAITGPLPDPPGVKLRKEGLKAKHPVVFVPGLSRRGLSCGKGTSVLMACFGSGFGVEHSEKHIRGNWVPWPLCWVEHLSLDNETGLDPPGIRVRPVSGLVAADYFAPGYFVWAVLIANLARIGYGEKTMYMASYDWRLSFQNTERHKVNSHIVDNLQLVTSHHSSSNGKHNHYNMAIAPGFLDNDIFSLQTLQHVMRMSRTWDSTMSMIPRGGATIWGDLDWSPEEGYVPGKTRQRNNDTKNGSQDGIENGVSQRKSIKYGRMISFGKDVAEAHSSSIERNDFRDAVKGRSIANNTCRDVWTEYHEMGYGGIKAVAEYKVYTAGSILDLLHFVAPKMMERGSSHFSYGIADNLDDPKYKHYKHWANPLETKLPNAPEMEIFSMYGVGIPTERAYVYKLSPSAECYIPFQIDTSADGENEDSGLKDGVYTVDGDETVPVLSAGFMCAKAWRGKTRFNPSGSKTYIREYDHSPPANLLEGQGTQSGAHVDIMGNFALTEDIMRVAAGATEEELGGDQVYSDIFKWSKKINLPLLEGAAVVKMSLQQAAQPKAYANGFGRRRAEREGGARLENKLQSGKSSANRSTIILKMARLTKDVSFRGQKAETLSRAPSKTLIIPGKEVVQVIAKDVSITMDRMNHELQCEKQQELMIDSFISQSRHTEVERELERWVPDEDDPQCPELENIFNGSRNRGWDQFETNEMLFGVKSTFDEELYTTKLERGPQMRELEKEAMRIAREIEGEDTQDLHLAEERGIQLYENFDIDEETRFSSVYRGIVIDDSGYDETEDMMLDSRNSETFGGTSAPSTMKSADLTDGKSNGGARVLSSSSLDEAQCSHSSTGADHHSGSYEHARQLPSEPPSKSLSTSESESRIQENYCGEQGANDRMEECVEEQTQVEDAHLPTCEDSLSSLNEKKDDSDKGVLSPNATAYAPSSNVSSKSYEKTSSPVALLEGAPSVKGVGEAQHLNSRGRPVSSTSSHSDCVGTVSVTNGRGLSPSSSVGSLSSEKSTLNPHAKEFKLNPNAKSFTPSQTPVRPLSPDGSLYFQPNIPSLPHMHGVPMGIGIGPSFTGHQPVIFNPQVASLQTPQAYFHPGGPEYGQNMLVGHPRQVLYMPSYQPVSDSDLFLLIEDVFCIVSLKICEDKNRLFSFNM